MKNKIFILFVSILVLGALLWSAPVTEASREYARQTFDEVVVKKLTVLAGGTEFRSDVTFTSDSDVTMAGDITLDNLAVENDTTLGDAAGDTITATGDMTLAGARDATTGNKYFMTISGNNDGITTSAKTYGLYINMTRDADDNTLIGDLDDAGLRIQVTNKMITPTEGNTLRGFNVQAKNDNPSGAITNLIGGLVSIQTDTGSPAAGNVSVGKALEVNTTVNAPITDTSMIADFRHFRQTATVPTQEYGIRVRNSSTTGTGADAALWIDSDGTAPTNNWDYGVDMVGADITAADIRLSNGETISNTVNGAVKIGGFLALDVGATQDLGATFIITPTASYQPITNSTGGSVTSDTSTAIADGAVAGALLIVCNEDAQDMVIKNAANTLLSGDLTLTGGANDCLTLLWNGADWVGLSMQDN